MYMLKRPIGTYGTRPRKLDTYDNKSSISLICTNWKVPLQIIMMSDVASVTSLKIQFTYVIGFSSDMNRGQMFTEERVFTIRIGIYMINFPLQDQLILRRINNSLLELDYNSKLNINLSILILLPYL